MTTLVGGIIALILGFIGLGLWSSEFVILLKGGIPIALILGGALATYLGVEEWKDAQSMQETTAQTPVPVATEAEKYRAEAEKYKAELESLKKQQEETPAPDVTVEE
ncbi:MAG: hypothetical protein KKB20_12105 [Proteobacteria bacterium]|nr:hypothetical protein [Pseudomonadota bacterium]